MKRILLVLTAATLTAAMMAVMAAPAMAIDLNSNDDDRNGFIFFGDDDRKDFDNFDNFGGFGHLDNENETESGEVDLSFGVSNTGDYASQCVPALQFGNTGNFNNSPSFAQFGSDSDDFEPGGIEFAIEPELAVDCSHTVQQSSAASSGYW